MKYFGNVGFVMTKLSKTIPDVYEEEVVTKPYHGDILEPRMRFTKGEHQLDDVDIPNKFSLLLDAFAMENFQYIKFIEWMGARWKVTEVDLGYPRITLSIGGVYNGPQ